MKEKDESKIQEKNGSGRAYTNEILMRLLEGCEVDVKSFEKQVKEQNIDINTIVDGEPLLVHYLKEHEGVGDEYHPSTFGDHFVKYNKKEVLSAFIRLGADLTLKTKDFRSALDFVSEKQEPEFYDILNKEIKSQKEKKIAENLNTYFALEPREMQYHVFFHMDELKEQLEDAQKRIIELEKEVQHLRLRNPIVG